MVVGVPVLLSANVLLLTSVFLYLQKKTVGSVNATLVA